MKDPNLMMQLFHQLEPLSRTVENRFVFDIFDLLLCGVIALVILSQWRAQTRATSVREQLLLVLAFASFGASFAVSAVSSGILLFFDYRLPQLPMALLAHSLQGGSWLLLAASAAQRSARFGRASAAFRITVGCLLLALLIVQIAAPLLGISRGHELPLEIINLGFLGLALALFWRYPHGQHRMTTAALAVMLISALLHSGILISHESGGTIALWNFEQFSWTVSLLLFALAVGETSGDLFDKVFVRIQVTFIVLAGGMILVISQADRRVYMTGIQGRSDDLVEFTRAHMDYFQQRNEPLEKTIAQEDFLHRITIGFANLPELKLIRVSTGSQVATFEIAGNGEIHHHIEVRHGGVALPQLDPDNYFDIQNRPLKTSGAGLVEFYGNREFFHRSIRQRILIMFALFTGVVTLSTMMIGLVVRGASATIRQQASEIEEQQKRLAQASKLAAIGELAAGVAHEINNPATTIMSRASFLLSTGAVASSEREDLNAIVSGAQRIANITRGLLLFSRPQVLKVSPVPIDRIIETSLRSVDETLVANRIPVEQEIEPDLPAAMVDESSMCRALENIFRNAADAMPDGGILTICARRANHHGTMLRLEISDTGAGIDPEILPRIFDPFFTTKEVGKGTGLGLSIVHGIITEHRGTITAASEPGVGTRFVMEVPTELKS